ncbi:FecR family protein [Pedobacter nototheniae]|uniref:FecR family protein n=1 Tax=Pedobacter nototheniae TaxID=2488994 RepID=UPI00292DA3C5|nr:FecR family protein [Pedobacter nototheniae]
MNQQSFIDLLTRYEKGNCTESEELFVNKWYDLLGDRNLNQLSAAELDEMSNRVWANLKTTPHPVKQFKLKRIWIKTAIAASITIAFLIAGLYAVNYNHARQSFLNENSGLTLITESNNTNQPVTLNLSDQSKITLAPNSSVIYPKVFAANKRNIYLKGNAFFAVSKNPKKPFYVYNQHLIVRVLGTSFSIRECGDTGPAQVSVRTGKVQVNENTKSRLIDIETHKTAKTILLTPNQKGVFANHQLNKTLVEKPIPLAVAYNIPNNISYNFKEERLGEIFKTLTEAYGIEIKSENEQILNYTFTGDLSKKGLYDQLNLICGSISGKYSINGTNIMVSNHN